MLELRERYDGERETNLDVIRTMKEKNQVRFNSLTGDKKDEARQKLFMLGRAEKFWEKYGCGAVCYVGKYVTLVVTADAVTGGISGEYHPCTRMRDYILPYFHNDEYNVNKWFDCIVSNMLVPFYDNGLPNMSNMTLEDVDDLDNIFSAKAVAKAVKSIDDYIYNVFITIPGNWYED